MIQETSQDAFEQINAEEWYGRIRALMLEHPERDWCISEVADALGAQKSSVSPRLNEMRRKGWITKEGKRPSEVTGITSIVYKLKH